MVSIFEVVPDNFFAILASPNKHVYFRALMVLRDCYQRELKFSRSDLVTYLISQMDADLYDMKSESDETGEAEIDGLGVMAVTYDDVMNGASDIATHVAATTDADTVTLSGRAHMLVRKLIDTGWVAAMMDADGLDETLIVPEYASVLLEVFHSLVEPNEKRYNAHVYSIYSSLRTADAERDEFMLQALQAANDSTLALRENLRSLLHNIHMFYQKLQDRKEVHELLAEHFDEYQLFIAVKTYHPLKTVDSVYRFRPRILQILHGWQQQPDVMQGMAQALQAQRAKRVDLDAHYEIVRMIHFILETFESIDSLLGEIDRRNTSYSRASAERLQYLLNTDRDVKGKLIELLKALPSLQSDESSRLFEEMANLPLCDVKYAHSDGIYTEKQRNRKEKPQPLKTRSDVQASVFQAEAAELIQRFQILFSQERIIDFILSQMGTEGMLRTENLSIMGMDDFLRTMIALIMADEPDLPFAVEWDDERKSVVVNGYRIPGLIFMKKG